MLLIEVINAMVEPICLASGLSALVIFAFLAAHFSRQSKVLNFTPRTYATVTLGPKR